MKIARITMEPVAGSEADLRRELVAAQICSRTHDGIPVEVTFNGEAFAVRAKTDLDSLIYLYRRIKGGDLG